MAIQTDFICGGPKRLEGRKGWPSSPGANFSENKWQTQWQTKFNSVKTLSKSAFGTSV
jgi:hypothetical protein